MDFEREKRRTVLEELATELDEELDDDDEEGLNVESQSEELLLDDELMLDIFVVLELKIDR